MNNEVIPVQHEAEVVDNNQYPVEVNNNIPYMDKHRQEETKLYVYGVLKSNGMDMINTIKSGIRYKLEELVSQMESNSEYEGVVLDDINYNQDRVDILITKDNLMYKMIKEEVSKLSNNKLIMGTVTKLRVFDSGYDFKIVGEVQSKQFEYIQKDLINRFGIELLYPDFIINVPLFKIRNINRHQIEDAVKVLPFKPIGFGSSVNYIVEPCTYGRHKDWEATEEEEKQHMLPEHEVIEGEVVDTPVIEHKE